MEVLPRLVPGTVFKTVEPHGNHVVGGFDSHALPPFFAPSLDQESLMIRSTLLCAFVCFVFAIQSVASAQISDQARRQRREFVGGLLKTLIESQVEGQDFRSPPPGPFQPGRVDPRVDPRKDPRVNPPRRPVPIRQPVAGSREMQQFRTHLNSFGQQCDGLVLALQSSQYDTRSARVLLADVMHVKAQCDALIRQAAYVAEPAKIVPAYQTFDQNWRVVTHRARQLPGIGTTCTKHIDQMYSVGTEICTCLGIDPSINRVKLLQSMSATKLSLQHLLQDLHYDNRDNPRVRPVIEQGQELYSQIGHGAQLVQREPYDVLVTAYKQNTKEWRRFARKLRPFKTERVRQGIQDIEELGRAIHQQLWLPIELDFEDILGITREIEADSNRLFASITLEDLMGCPNPGLVINSAREFQSNCGTFANSLDQRLESWIWDYQLFNVQWQTLRRLCEPIQVPRVVRRIKEIDDAMDGLNQMLGQGPAVTHHDLIDLYSQLDGSFTDLDLTIRRNIANDRNYDRVLRQDMVNRSRLLHDSVHRCQQALLRGGSQSDLNDEFASILSEWTLLKQQSSNCNEQHRKAFAKYRREIEPVMVKLQVVFTN